MVYHRQYLTRSILHVCDILSTRAIHDEKTRLKHLFFWTPFACSCARCHGNSDRLSRAPDTHGDDHGHHFFDDLSYSLHAYHEAKYLTKIPLSANSRLSRTSRNIWWRCVGYMTRTDCNYGQLYTSVHHTVAHSSLCSSLICSKYF